MNSYKISFEQIRQEPEITEMLSALHRGLDKFGIDFYLVGAVARDVWMIGINKIAPRKTTGDIDFAIRVSDIQTYKALKDYLINTEGFKPFGGNSFVLRWKDNRQVDLLPFGEIEDEDSKVKVDGSGLTEIRLDGFNEVFDEGLPNINLEGIHRFKFCTLPGIFLLKMIAWDDRPEIRRGDITDISDILHHFFDMYVDEIYENHLDLFGGVEEDMNHLAARVMGREIGKIAKRNAKLNKRIESILNANTADLSNCKMGALMVEYFGNTVEDNLFLLRKIRKGFNETQHEEKH